MAQRHRILVVEDDPYIQELVAEFLKAQDYEVDVADDGSAAWKRFSESAYDLIILDIMLPNLDGYSLCRMIRRKSDVPIIVLTALSEEKDQLKAFELLADDYISKPFSFNVLVKRVEAVIRRAGSSPHKVLQLGALKLDCDGYKTYVHGKEIELTVTEFELLRTLIENRKKVLTRDILIEKIWGYNYFGDKRIVDAHIKNIRKKINVPYIKTIKGLGYSIDEVCHEN